jgi:hypothetical protein
MEHYKDNKAEEGEDVLDYKQFVPEISDRCQGGEIQPHKKGICFDTYFASVL